MEKADYESPVVWLVLLDPDDIVRMSPNDDGAINAGNSSITDNWWDQ